jgi:SHS2 domain-containing protein
MGERTGGYELIDHPAEVGLRAWGPTPEDAFTAAAEGMASVIVDPTTVRVADWRSVAVEADDPASLLARWLNEILYLLDAEAFVPAAFRVEHWRATALQGQVGGEPAAPERHGFRTAVKTVTYHQLRVEQRDGVWWVEAVLDV